MKPTLIINEMLGLLSYSDGGYPSTQLLEKRVQTCLKRITTGKHSHGFYRACKNIDRQTWEKEVPRTDKNNYRKFHGEPLVRSRQLKKIKRSK